MTKVITYGTYDLLHEGHIRLLERARALGDYLIVGVTADGFDKARGKINVQQSLMERIQAVKNTGLADEIVVEEYEGQKIDDIRKYGVDIFTVGSDWKGHFDYLNEFCKVIYLERTEGISSSEIRATARMLRIGIIGETGLVNKFARECSYVNGVRVSGIYAESDDLLIESLKHIKVSSIEKLFEQSDAIYVASHPQKHYAHIKKALLLGRHVLCESPVTTDTKEFEELTELAKERNLVLMDAVKTAYSLAFKRLLLLLKGKEIGDVVSIETTCTSLLDLKSDGSDIQPYLWNSICWWGPNALLPIFDIFGGEYKSLQLYSKYLDNCDGFDMFTQGSFIYKKGVATFKVGHGVKSEGDMVISGTRGYIYVPAPWWKTDYFEVRYENQADNRRYFYQLEGEGIRNEILSFYRATEGVKSEIEIPESTSMAIISIVQQVMTKKE